ncbi:MAG: hypothetical protein U1D67_00475, partial [Dehalococcoidia bacterium]|nr:hypothetical protein [Dehalococcoidia bacterium]
QPYFKGKTISIIVPFSAGGGTDTIARIVAGLLPKYLPGNPSVVVKNSPGGGGASATNSFYIKSKPDGLTLLQASSSQIAVAMRGMEIARYDVTKFRYIGNVSRAEAILVANKAKIKQLTTPGAEPLYIGSRDGQEAWNAMLMWGKEFLGWNVKWILGFEGTGEIELAYRRGELDLLTTQNVFMLKPLIEEGQAEPVAQVGIYKNGKFERRPDFPDVPTFVDVLGDKRPTGVPWQAYMSWVGPTMLDKFILAPPGTPDNIIKILTDGFTEVSKDLKFDEMVTKTMGKPYDVGVGNETENIAKELMATPKEALDYGVNLQNKLGFGVQ